MKTTLELPDELYRQAKAMAALRGQTMKDWLTALLHRELQAPSAPRLAEVDQAMEREVDAFNAELDRLAQRITADWQGPQDAADAVHGQRRTLGA
jgi:hypothetical protein